MDKQIIEHARKEYATADKDGKQLLERLFGIGLLKGKPSEWATTLQDICEALGKNYDEEFAQERMQWFSPTQRAQKEWELIAEAYNEGEEPDYSNSNQGKYYPYYRYQKGVSGRGLRFLDVFYAYYGADVGPRQTFKTSELARRAVERFPETFDTYYNG